MPPSVHYVHLPNGDDPPETALAAPFRAVVVAEEVVRPEWRSKVSAWLVSRGCVYMCAWGTECSEWDTAVDMASIEANSFEEAPEDKLVMTTWHESESLLEAFSFAKNNAHHPTVAIRNTLLVHVAGIGREKELLAAFAEA